MKRKMITLLLAFAMLCTTLFGCGQEEKVELIDDMYRNYYQIFPGSYYDSNGDGSGDLQGIIGKLDYIADMGFNGIWMTPIMPSPSYHKYDVTDYYAIEPAFGTMEDYQMLVEECHKRGIRLIVDLVFNHTSSEHPWFQEAVTYLEGLSADEEPDVTACPYVEYYYFAKEGEQPGDWHKAGNSNYYYEGVFWYGMPDLNLDNEAVRKEFEDIAKFWLDMGTDGFRLDAAKEYFSGYANKNTEVLAWFTDYVKSVNENAYLVAEVWEAQDKIEEYYMSGIDSLFNFPAAMQEGVIIKTASSRVDVSAYVDWMIKQRADNQAQNPTYIDAPFVSNHDTTRISAQSMNNEEAMKYAAGLLLMMPGSPFVYYGEEIGMRSLGTLDENKRLPMYWSATETEGITDPPAAAEEVEQVFPALDEQMEDETSIYNYYKNALKMRNSYPEIARGEVTKVEGTYPEGTAATLRQWEEEACVVVYCNAKEGASVNLADAGLADYKVQKTLSVGETAVEEKDGTLVMPFGSIVIMK